MASFTKKGNIKRIQYFSFIFRYWYYMMHIYFIFTSLASTFLTSTFISFKDKISKCSVFCKVSTFSYTFPVTMIFTFCYAIRVKTSMKTFIPRCYTFFRFSPFFLKLWVILNELVDLRPIIVRFVTLLVSHSCKSRTFFFSKTFIPGFIGFKGVKLTNFAIMSPTILRIMLTFLIPIWACFNFLPTTAFAYHGIHYTKKLQENQEKSGEFLGYPNVKTRAIRSQALEGISSNEGSETMRVSPNNNLSHECPTRKGRYSPSCMDNIQNYGLNGHKITKLNSIPFTKKLELLSMYDVEEMIKKGLLDDYRKCMDGLVEREMNKTYLNYVGITAATYTLTTDSTLTATNTSVFNKYHLKNMVDELAKRNIPPWDGEDYVCIGSIEAIRGILDDLESTKYYIVDGYKNMLAGEVGRYYGVRFIRDNYATRYIYDEVARTSTRTGTVKVWSGGYSGDAYIFGKGTVAEAVAEPEHVIPKEVSDYQRSKGLAWYFVGGYKILWEDEGNSRIIKWASAS